MSTDRQQGGRSAREAEAAEPTSAIHVRYAQTRDPWLRERLVERHSPLARSLARRFAGRGEEVADLEQVALMALVKAVDRFDPGRERPFSAFASLTILGELKRHFRDTRWGVRVGRSLQERYLRARDANEELRAELGRAPTPAEVAVHLGDSEERVLEAMAAGAAFRVESFDAPLVHAPAGRDDYVALIDRLTMAQLLAQLPHRDREMIHLRFVDGRSQSDIAAAVGLSQMHVSRELKRILLRLRDRVSA